MYIYIYLNIICFYLTEIVSFLRICLIQVYQVNMQIPNHYLPVILKSILDF